MGIDRHFRDKTGAIVLVQLPNLPLAVFIAASVLARIFHAGLPGAGFRLLAFGSIVAWSWWEIVAGVTTFRRGLGLVVLVLSLLSATWYHYPFG